MFAEDDEEAKTDWKALARSATLRAPTMEPRLVWDLVDILEPVGCEAERGKREGPASALGVVCGEDSTATRGMLRERVSEPRGARREMSRYDAEVEAMVGAKETVDALEDLRETEDDLGRMLGWESRSRVRVRRRRMVAIYAGESCAFVRACASGWDEAAWD